MNPLRLNQLVVISDTSNSRRQIRLRNEDDDQSKRLLLQIEGCKFEEHALWTSGVE